MSAHIVILGCGFAALTAVRELRRRDREVRITLDRGILVYRDEKRALILPPCRLFHWAKRFFEWNYLRPYRKAQRA